MDGTPILDIKPYIPFTDCHPDASDGYTAQTITHELEVDFPEALLKLVPEDKKKPLLGVLAQDPRPSYQEDAGRVYGLQFAGMEIKFRVSENRLTVVSVE
jgi:hypothetical protein